MNPYEAEASRLSVSVAKQRTASNIDFDFEPAPVQIDHRYAVAIAYHFLRPADGFRFRVPAAESPERFAVQIGALQENFSFCRSRELTDPKAELGESNIMIHFDDGSKDVSSFAAQILRQFGVTATVFVCAQPYTEGRMLAVHKIMILMAHLGLDRFRQAFYAELERQNPKGVDRDAIEYANGYKFYRYDSPEVKQFKLDLNYLIPYDRLLPVLDAIFADVFGKDNEKEAIKQFYLSIDDLKRLVDDGHELGIHGYDHKVLPRLDYKGQKRNIEATAEFLEPLTGKSQLSVAYPYGFSDNATKRALKELGVVAGYSMERRIITPKDLQQRWNMPRFDVNDCFDKKSNRINYEVFSSLSTGD